MAKKPDIWMPVYIRDYLGDTRSFNAVEHGAYLLLLMEYWMTGGPIPNDTKSLLNICCLRGRGAVKTLNRVVSKFQVDADTLRHKRVDKELAKALENKRIAVESGRKGADARWGGHKGPHKGGHKGPQWGLDGSSPSPSPPINNSLLKKRERAEPKVTENLVLFGKEFLRMTGEEFMKLKTDFGAALLAQEVPEMDLWISKAVSPNARKYRKPNHNHYLFARNWLRDKKIMLSPEQRISKTNGNFLNSAERRNQILKQEMEKARATENGEKQNDKARDGSIIDADFKHMV